MNPKFAGILRHAATFAAGVLVVTGKASPDQIGQAGDLINTGAAAVLGLGGLLWSWFSPEKR